MAIPMAALDLTVLFEFVAWEVQFLKTPNKHGLNPMTIINEIGGKA